MAAFRGPHGLVIRASEPDILVVEDEPDLRKFFPQDAHRIVGGRIVYHQNLKAA